MKVSWEYQTGTRQDADEWICDLLVVLTAEERTAMQYWAGVSGYPVLADYVVHCVDKVLGHSCYWATGTYEADLVTAETIPNDAK